MNAAFGVMINDETVFYRNFLKEGIRTIGVFDPTSATAGLNYLLREMRNSFFEVGILIHQDAAIPDDWIQKVETNISALPEKWLVAGLWGAKNVEGFKNYYGNIIDRRVARKVGADHPVGMYSGPLPKEVDTLDEVCLIVNLKYSFQFDERYRGFDLYGSYICLWAQKHGYSAWAIDAPITHETRRTWAWKPDQVFLQNWDHLDKDFPWPEYTVLSTVY